MNAPRPTRDEYLSLFDRAPEPMSARFPDIPPPTPDTSPEILAARWINRQLLPETLPKIAADLLETGYDTPALRRLAAETQIWRSTDAEELAARAFRSLGIPYPFSDKEAQVISNRQIGRQVIAGQRNAWKTASHLVMTWDRERGAQYMWELDELLDAIDIDPEYRPTPEALTEELYQLFARMARD